MMLHSEFRAVWLSLSGVLAKITLLINIHIEQVPATLRPFHTRHYNRIRCALVAFTLNPVLSDAHRVNPPQEVDWNRINCLFI